MPNPGDVQVYVGPEWSAMPIPLGPTDFGSIIYRPGGVTAKDVVATWPEVQAFITKADGKCFVYVDDSIVSPAPVPGTSGITECFGRVELRPFVIDPVNFTILQVESGATLDNLYAATDIELRCNPSDPTIPSLAWTIAPNGGFLLLQQYAILSNAPTATATAINVPAGGKGDLVLLNIGSIVLNNPDHSLFNVPLGATLVIQAFNSSLIDSNFASGVGAVELDYDAVTAAAFQQPGTPPTFDGFTGSYAPTNLDDLIIKQTFTTATINNDVFQLGPRQGIRPVTFRGCGGGGGGGGGSGANATDAGSGGAAGGASMYQEITVDVDFSHRVDMIIDGGGASGGAGSGVIPGANGGDGGPSYVLDFVTQQVLCAFQGASGGAGGQTSGGGPFAISQGGSNISGVQFADGTGFVASGGSGGPQGNPGIVGVSNTTSIGATIAAPAFSPVWLPGAAGTSGDLNQGGGGGGGGQGPFGNGGDGGSCIAGVTTAGGSPVLGSGGGAGGGGGGGLVPPAPPNAAGTAGGTGGSGQITS